MNKELAKTLTIALVNYIDENRPEGTMDCSSGECERLEKAFEVNNLDFVEGFMEKKLSRLTEFEQEVSDMVEYCKEHGKNVAFDYAKRHAQTLLDLAKKELARRDEVITLDSLPPYDKGFQDGKAEALKDLPRWEDIRNFAYSWTSEDKTFYNDTLGQLFHKGKKLFIEDLEKLPGFKEDKI